jgi:hypothetical protein
MGGRYILERGSHTYEKDCSITGFPLRVDPVQSTANSDASTPLIIEPSLGEIDRVSVSNAAPGV